LGALGAGLLNKESLAYNQGSNQPDAPKIQNYRRLGRTGAMVSDIGCGAPSNGTVLKAVLESGVNFIETSESYDNGRNEQLIGNAIKDFQREKLFIATKAFPAMKVFRSADDVIQRAEGSLGRLQTDYIDLYMIHQAQSIVRVKDDYFHKAADILKKEGKIRFTGMSCHGPEWGLESIGSLEEILMAAVEDGRFDAVMLPYNYLASELGERILTACRKHDIGTIIMKSNPVIAYENYERLLKNGREVGHIEKTYYDGLKESMDKAGDFFRKYNMNDMEALKDGAIQFILSNPEAHTICCRFPTFAAINKYVRLSGTTLDNRIAEIMNDFREQLGFLNCRIGCNICEGECPHRVPVSTIMRYNYYFHAHHLEKKAMQYYLDLPGETARHCADCEGYCEKACPYKVPARSLLTAIHDDLSFDPPELIT